VTADSETAARERGARSTRPRRGRGPAPRGRRAGGGVQPPARPASVPEACGRAGGGPAHRL